MSEPQQYIVELDTGAVKCYLYWEQRCNVRFSMTRKGPVLRAPIASPPSQRKKVLRRFERWVYHTLHRRSDLLARYTGKPRWQDGDEIEVMGRVFRLHIALGPHQRPAAQLSPDGRTIQVRLCARSGPVECQEARTRLLSRLLAQHFYPQVYQRLATLNACHFGLPLPTLSLRYAHTRWGSCTARRRITLNTRLLLAPSQVLDYVIIHELAHCIHPNHSKAFWGVVARAMPDYRTWHQWLRHHGNILDF